MLCWDKEIGITWLSKQVGNLNGLALTVLPCHLSEQTQSNTEIFRGCWPYMTSTESLGTCLLLSKRWLHSAPANIDFPHRRTWRFCHHYLKCHYIGCLAFGRTVLLIWCLKWWSVTALQRSPAVILHWSLAPCLWLAVVVAWSRAGLYCHVKAAAQYSSICCCGTS